MFCSKTEIVSLSAAILLSTMATYFPVSRGSSSLSIQLLPRKVAAAAGAACWAPGHTGGSVIAVSCPHAVKEMIHMYLNGEFYHFLDKQLENNSVSSVLQWLLCVIKRQDLGAHRALTATLTDTVSLLLPSCLHTKPCYSLKCNTVNRSKRHTENKLQVSNSATFNPVLAFARTSEGPMRCFSPLLLPLLWSI